MYRSNILQTFENIKSNLLFKIFDQIQIFTTFDVYLKGYFNYDLRHWHASIVDGERHCLVVLVSFCFSSFGLISAGWMQLDFIL